MKSVRSIGMWVAVFAIATSWAGSAQAANLSTIMSQLGASRGDFFSSQPGGTFFAIGTVKINVIESTGSSSFGITNGTSDSLYTFQRTNGSNGAAFAVLANGTLGYNPPTNTDFADGGTATATTISSSNNGSSANLAVTARQRSSGDISQQIIGTPLAASGAPVSSLVTLNGIGTLPFQFVLRTPTRLDNIDNSSFVTDYGSTRLTSNDASFSAYNITSGPDAGRYLIAFEQTDSLGQTFTFAAIVEGVVNPEPASMAMIGTGLIGLVGYRARRRLKAAAAV